jgi:molecular chaperone IbpA
MSMLLLTEDVVMRQNFDFAPLFGSTVGFDRVFDLLQSATRAEQSGDKFPPYDIERVGEDAYKIVVAVAGFRSDELTMTADRNLLTIEGKRAPADPSAGQREILHRGIGARAFKQTFQLADHVKVTSASLADGLLTVDLVREIPEVMRPRQIQIGGNAPESQPNQIENQAA